MIGRRMLLAAAAAGPLVSRAGAADWNGLEAEARGGTVFWRASASDDRTNALIAWVAERLRASHGIAVRHVRSAAGPADLVSAVGSGMEPLHGSAFGPVPDLLPNAALLHRRSTSGGAVPWLRGQLSFVCDGARVADPPRSMAAMAAWAAAHPGRLVHPTASSGAGVSFLAQAMVELVPDFELLMRPAGADFERLTAPLWAWYLALRPCLWRRGTGFPSGATAQRALLAAGEVDIMASLNPSDAAAAIVNGTLPRTARVFGLAGGTIGSLTFNVLSRCAVNRAPALVLANFLLSPEAQAHAADPAILGVPTVLAPGRLTAAERGRFPPPPDLGPVLRELHPSWTSALAGGWERLVASGSPMPSS
jgi:putative thiamine transport system substrate-binding protein